MEGVVMADNNINGSSFGDMLGQAILAKRFGIKTNPSTEVEKLIARSHAQDMQKEGMVTLLERHYYGDPAKKVVPCTRCAKNEPCRSADYAYMVDTMAVKIDE